MSQPPHRRKRRYPRPLTVSIIAFLLFLEAGIFGFIGISMLTAGKADDPRWVGLACLAGSIFTGVVAVFLLLRAPWSRVVFYAVYAPLAAGFAISQFDKGGLRLLIWLAILCVLLARDSVTRYFTGQNPSQDREYGNAAQDRTRESSRRYDY